MTLRRKLAVILTAALFAVGCSGSETPTATSKERLLIGVMGNFQGPELPRSAGIAKAVELAVTEYNQDPNSTYSVRVVRADTKGTAEGTAPAAQTLVARERLIGVVGPFDESQIEIASPVLQGVQMPTLIPNVISSTVAKPDWLGFRRLVANDQREGKLMAKAMPGSGLVAIFQDTTPSAAAFVQAAAEGFAAQSRPIRVEQVGPRSSLNTIVRAIQAEGVEAVLYAGSTKSLTNLIAAVGKSGFKGPQYASSHLKGPRPPGDAPNGLYAAGSAADLRDGRTDAFEALYREKVGGTPVPYAIESYEGAWMLLEAVQEVEPKPATISEFFQLNRGFLGDSKSYEYTENGEVRTAPIWLYQVRGTAWSFVRRYDG